ncbi:MAG: circularly permuted type 2 ATP-grasp protein, partial [Planctomycetota bacterium]
MFDGYQPASGRSYDEMFAGGQPRPEWRAYRQLIDRIGVKEFSRRWDGSQRQIYENGIAFSAYGEDPGSTGDDDARPWALDPLPLLMPIEQWRPLAAGLVQRARVLERVLADLYGPQELIADGVLPAELIYSHPGYHACLHRSAAGTPEEADPPRLELYSADLGRAPDGAWWVMADRSEAPSGLGFALENRVVMSRMLAEPYRDCRVRRLAPFFIQLMETLADRAPDRVLNPRVAILGEGPGHANYFEDAYLARYLGYTLVEGGDLTVRNRRLWLKTLAGLEPIDALVRRPNTELCDPLELGGESPSGVAGLIQAARDGNVLMANPPGSGLVESPVFMAFMPRLCQAVLGEPLTLPGVATWWCGERDSREYVLNNLERLTIKPAYRDRGAEAPAMRRIADASPDQLARWIRENPLNYVAQEKVDRSTAPTWVDGSVGSGRVALRTFAVAAGDSFTVMEGALGRLSESDPLELTLESGEGSKDVWIVSDEPVQAVTLLDGEEESITLVRFGAELPSRVADNSFWLGRRLERADASARLARTLAMRLTSESDPAQLAELPALLRAIAEQGQIEPGYVVEELRDLLPHVDKSLPSQVLNHDQPESLSAAVDLMFQSATEVRDRLSRDTWRIILRISNKMRGVRSRTVDLTDLLNLTDELVIDLAAVGGMVLESMTRTQFYRFLDVGRRIERAVQSAALLRACLVESPFAGADGTGQGAPPRSLLEALLDCSDSLMTYRSRYRAN